MGKIFSLMATVVFLFTASFSVQASEAMWDKGVEAMDRADYNTALRIFSGFAAQGFVPAYYVLGLLHKDGNGTPKNLKKAQELFEKAGSKRHAASAYYLALMYFGGEISTSTEKETQEKLIYWLRIGAEEGSSGAQFMLGNLYLTADIIPFSGLPKDPILSYMWTTVSVENGGDDSGMLATQEEGMTYKNVIEAKKLAKACIKQMFEGCATVSSMTKKITKVKKPKTTKPKITKPKANTKTSNESGIECNFNKFSGVGQADAEGIVTSYLGEKFILNKADNKITLGWSDGWNKNPFEIQQVKENSKFTTYIFKEKLKVSKNKSDPKHTIRRSYRIYKKKNVTKAYGEILNANFPIMIAEGVCN